MSAFSQLALLIA